MGAAAGRRKVSYIWDKEEGKNSNSLFCEEGYNYFYKLYLTNIL